MVISDYHTPMGRRPKEEETRLVSLWLTGQIRSVLFRYLRHPFTMIF